MTWLITYFTYNIQCNRKKQCDNLLIPELWYVNNNIFSEPHLKPLGWHPVSQVTQPLSKSFTSGPRNPAILISASSDSRAFAAAQKQRQPPVFDATVKRQIWLVATKVLRDNWLM